MARLGLRPKEVVAIRLDDINWAAGEIVVRGKGGHHDRMPLPTDVGETIVAISAVARAGNTRHLFVTIRAPHGPLTSATIKKTFRQAFAKTGLKPPNGEIRSHVMRHSLAVALLGRGASLGEVGEVLRRRSLQPTTTYARYDGALGRSPGRGRCRERSDDHLPNTLNTTSPSVVITAVTGLPPSGTCARPPSQTPKVRSRITVELFLRGPFRRRRNAHLEHPAERGARLHGLAQAPRPANAVPSKFGWFRSAISAQHPTSTPMTRSSGVTEAAKLPTPPGY